MILSDTLILPISQFQTEQVMTSQIRSHILYSCAHFVVEIDEKSSFNKVKSNYFIVRPEVDQRAGLLSLPHLGNFHRTARSQHLPLLRKHSPEGAPVLNGVHL